MQSFKHPYLSSPWREVKNLRILFGPPIHSFSLPTTKKRSLMQRTSTSLDIVHDVLRQSGGEAMKNLGFLLVQHSTSSPSNSWLTLAAGLEYWHCAIVLSLFQWTVEQTCGSYILRKIVNPICIQYYIYQHILKYAYIHIRYVACIVLKHIHVPTIHDFRSSIATFDLGFPSPSHPLPGRRSTPWNSQSDPPGS